MLVDPFNVQCVHIYDYCNNNPIMFVDYTGYWLSSKIKEYYKQQISNCIRSIINTCARHKLNPNKKTYYKKVIAFAATEILKDMKCLLSAEMFCHALYGEGKSLFGDTLRFLKTRLRTSKTLTDKIPKQIKNAKSKRKTSFTVTYKSLEFPKSKDKDLYYSLQHVYIKINGRKQSSNKWSITWNLKDRYDFTDFSRTIKYGLSIGNVSNDFGVILQDQRMLIPYNINITHTYKVPG